MRALLGVLALAALAGAGASPAGADAAPPRTVRVDVIATDTRGQPVRTLTRSDFELREDGAAQTIDEARFIGIDRSPSAGERLFAVFLDEYHVSAANTDRVRTALLRFLDDTLNPQDQVVVMRPLDSVFAIALTRDRDQMREAVGQFEGRQADYTPRNAYERNYVAGTPTRIEQLRAQVATSALNALAVHLGSLGSDTRKTLVVVSEALPRADRRRGLEGLPTVDTVIRSANRSNVSIYAVDPREATVHDAALSGADALRALAASTDGRFLGGVDLPAAMRQIADDSSAYYLLAYKTARQKDGKFHEVQVGVRQPGVTVRTRSGYWSPVSDDELRASLSRPPAPLVLEPPRHISPYIRPWFGTSRGKDGRTRVTFVWEPAGRLPGARQPPAARVVLKALAGDGTPLFEGPVLPTSPLQAASADDTQARAVFDAPPGVLRLRMSIESAAEQPIDTDVRDITVRDLSAPVVLGTPAVLRARTARDFRALETDPEAAPAASREFSRTERLMFRVPGYAPPGAPLTLSARLLNRSGQTMRDLALRQEGAVTPALGIVDLPLAGFANGEYRIEFAAKSPAGEVKDLLVFRVTN